MHGRVTVDNMSNAEESTSANSIKAFKHQSVEATTTALVPSQPGPEKASALPVILARQWALDWSLKVVRRIGRSVSIHEISCCLLLIAFLLAPALPLLCSLLS